jgi:hypothetical protein
MCGLRVVLNPGGMSYLKPGGITSLKLEILDLVLGTSWVMLKLSGGVANFEYAGSGFS